MTDDEILAFFKTKPAHTCGRFRPNQLKLYSMPATTTTGIRPGLKLLQAGMLSLMFALMNKPASGNAMHTKTSMVMVDSDVKTLKSYSATVEDKVTLSGVVLDVVDGTPIPGANIILMGTDRGVTTDAEGKFTFHDLVPGDVLIVSFIGYIRQEYIVPHEAEGVITLSLEMYYDIMGAVAVDTPYSGDQSSGVARWWRKIKNMF